MKRTVATVGGELNRSRVILRASRHSGLNASFGVRGFVEVGRALLTNANNPALVYRIHGRDRPNDPALIFRDRTISFGEVHDSIGRVASALRHRGVVRDASVLLVLRNRPEFVIAQNAVAILGAAAISASPHATPQELKHLATHSGAAVAIVEAELLDRVREAAGCECKLVVVGEGAAAGADVETWDTLAAEENDATLKTADDASVVVYTSGTTGKPKGAVRRFPRNTIVSTMHFIESTPMRARDVHLVVAPLYHSTAYAFATMTHLLGGTVVLMEHFTPAAFVDMLSRHRVNTTALVPTMFHRIVEYLDETGGEATRLDLPDLRVMFSGGAPLSGALAQRVMDKFGDVLFNFYGATETGLVTLAGPDDLRAAPGTIGRAIPGVEIRLVDESGTPVAPGETGELYARSALVTAGYLHDTNATQAATLEGFFSVGDLARMDDAGRYFLEGRKRELIISGGVNVYPVEVEHALEEHPAIAEAAVVGAMDDEWGERVQAFVVPRPEHTVDVDEVRTWMKSRVAGPKVPRDIFVLRELPRNPTGKVLKGELVQATR